LESLEQWTEWLDEGGAVDIIYLDYRKAFDSVPHRRLLYKLSKYGISGQVWTWIQNFLTDRTQRVRISGSFSDSVSVLSGVPQGSVLGPTLFLLYVNEIPDLLTSSRCKMFADDTKIYRKVATDADTQSLQEDLGRLVNWSSDWLLDFNTEKCKVLHLGSSNVRANYIMSSASNLSEISSEKDVGVWIHESMKPSMQCSNAAKKGMRALALARRSFDLSDKKSFIKLYVHHLC
jgi:hypothetical protein